VGVDAELWSAADCCRFPARERARGNFNRGHNSQPASWLAPKRQQAAALQSGLRPHKHWVWDTGLLQAISRNPATFAAALEKRITPQELAEWQKGSIDDWAGRIANESIAEVLA
jgi:predicted 2-oxoglutarate/Fe(II)-dependent dioxygenase YbiX